MEWTPPATCPASLCQSRLASTASCRRRSRALFEDADAGIPGLLRPALGEAVQEIGEVEGRLRTVERQLETAAAAHLVVSQLRTVPGIGVLTATALVATVGDVQRFPSARHFGSYLDLTPREHSSGTRRHLGAISKRGDTYLRMLLIHGARAVLWHAKRRTARPLDRLRTWALRERQIQLITTCHRVWRGEGGPALTGARAKPITGLATKGRSQTIGSPCASSFMARSVTAPERGRRYGCSPSRSSHTSLATSCGRSPDTAC